MNLKEYVRDLENLRDELEKIERAEEAIRKKQEKVDRESQALIEEVEYVEKGATLTEQQFQRFRELVENRDLQRAEKMLEQEITRR